MQTANTLKELKDLRAPEGHTFAGHSLAYWRKHHSALECYTYCKWDGYNGEKQQVIVECVPDVDSLQFRQGTGCEWTLADHDSKDCEHCGTVYKRNRK